MNPKISHRNRQRRCFAPSSSLLLLCLGLFLTPIWTDLSTALAATKAEEENDYYELVTIPIPDGIILEAGAIQVFDDQRLAVSTRLGEIYFVDGAFEARPTATSVKFTQYAQGLHEVLGLTTRGDGWFYATQRGEVTRIKDLDGDDRADVFETVADGWGITGDYHEYAFGSKFDAEGNIWVVLCLTGSFSSETPFRGWCMRVTPDGQTLPTASGIRSPGGIATNHVGQMFYTDNQGPWNGPCWLKHLKPGGFMGHPGGNKWYEFAENMGPRPADPVSGSRIGTEWARIPELVPPAVAFPYNKMGQSASGIQNDFTAGKFGPFSNQLFVGDQTWSTVMRVYLEEIKGVYQGACFPFREGLDSGSLSLEMCADGSLFVGGTARGWGARGGKPFALQRLRWTGKTPFEIHEMRIRSDGFELTFTEPVDTATAGLIESYALETYTYLYRAEYGSPEVDGTRPPIRAVQVSPDGMKVRLFLDLVLDHVHEVKLPGIRNREGSPLLHPVAYYTVNVVPDAD